MKSRNSTFVLSLAALGPLLAATPALGQQAPGAAERGASTAVELDELIVTANKRAESILDVAGAISAYSGENLLKADVTSIAGLAGLTPGLQFNAGYGTGAPIVRGVNTGADFGQAVGITVDGAPMGPSSSFQAGGASSLDLDPIDLQRVEVLKGPQGTVYGANTLAGLVSYTLRQPDLAQPTMIARASLGSTEHGGDSRSVRAAASLPVVEDQLALGLSGFYDRRAGFIDNEITGGDNQNRWRSYGVQASALYNPTDRLSIFAAAFYQRQNQYAQDQVTYGADGAPLGGDLTYNDYLVPSTNRETRLFIGKVDYELGFADLTSVTSYQHLNVNYSLPQNTGTLNTIFVNVLPQLGGVTIPPPGLLSNDTFNDFKKVTQELRLTSTGEGPVSWLAGAYFTHEESEQQQSVNARTTSGELASSINPTLRVVVPTELTEYSAFGNITYAFSSSFDVTGGFRIGRIEQVNRTLLSGSNFAAYNLLFVVSGLGAGPPADTGELEGSKTVTTWLATGRYHFSSDGMIFARFATGFRPGGPNFPVPGLDPVYDPDKTYNYELGLKTRFWDGRGTLDVTGYYLDWKDFLAFTSASGLSGFVNAGDARVYGVESAVNVTPIQGLTLSGTLAYSDSKVTRVVPGSLVAQVGDELPYNPQWSGSLSAEYRVPLAADWDVAVGGTARFVGERNSSPDSSLTAPNYRLPSYELYDVRLALEGERWDVEMFVRNLTDERAQLAAFTQLGVNQVTVQQPRTVGASLTFKY